MDNIKAIKADFRNFLYTVWKHLLLPDPTPVQYDIANYLQYGPKRLIIEGFRGVGKSWITSAYVLWRLLIDPEYKFLVVSASKDRSDDFSTFTLRLISEMPLLQHLMPDPNRGQRFSKVAFDVAGCKASHAPSVKSRGIFGQLTGSRATEIIADDIEVPKNSTTQDMREKLLKACMEFEAIIVPEVGKIKYLGTPQTEESIYNKLRERGYACRIWPARYPSPEKVAIYAGALAPGLEEKIDTDPSVAGAPTDPKRFSDIDLIEREAAYGRSGFALQFQLDTSLSDAEKYPLKTSDLIILPLSPLKAPISLAYGSNPELQIKDIPNPGFTGDRMFRPLFIDKEWTEYEGCVMFIDPAGRGQDELAWAVVKQLHGNLFLTSSGGLSGGYEDANLSFLANEAKLQKAKLILIESNFGDGMFTKVFTPFLSRIYPCTTEEVRATVQKERRIIDTLEPVFNQHRLIVDEGVVRKDIGKTLAENPNYSLFYQMTRLTKDRGSLKHDDRLDALAGAVAYWVESMARDELKAVSSWQARALEDELRGFVEHALWKDRQFFDSKTWLKSSRTSFIPTKAPLV